MKNEIKLNRHLPAIGHNIRRLSKKPLFTSNKESLMRALLIIGIVLALCCPATVHAQTLEQVKKQQIEKTLKTAEGQKIVAAVKKYSEMYKLDEKLILAVIMTESGFNKNAVSTHGCSGLMQLAPRTFKARNVGSNIFDIDQNIQAGTIHLAGMTSRYKGDIYKGLGSYNMGGGAFDRTYKNGKMHPAAKHYVDRVFYYKHIFENINI